MKVRRIRSWEELEALPEGQWVEVEEGIEFRSVSVPSGRRSARVVIPLKPEVARSLRPREGEVLEARMRGGNVELTRRLRRPRKAVRQPIASHRA